MFNEFNEYDNPENTDYDITVGINTDDNSQNTEDNSITQQEIDDTLLKLNLNLIYYNDDKFNKFIQSIYINKNRLLFKRYINTYYRI